MTTEATIPCQQCGSVIDSFQCGQEFYEFGHKPGARVVTLTQETDTLTVHTRAEPPHYDVEKKSRWVSEWEGVQE